MTTHTNINPNAYYFADTSFNLLMQKRIRKVLVICSSYDFFMLEEDGRIDEQIFNEYVSLNLRYPPVFVHADTAEKAFEMLSMGDIDLAIPMLSIRDVDTFKLARILKVQYPQIPIVVLTHFSREVSLRLEKEDLSAIDHVFCWLGNTDIFLAIIKMIEDQMNADNDILEIGVQAILLVEDSIRYISSYLPNLYHIILEQSKQFMTEALNEHQQMLRRRGRPKILLVKSYEEALQTYNKYKGRILGIISDVSYKTSPSMRDTKAKSGLKLCKKVKGDDLNLPFLLQSSDIENEAFAKELGVGFLNKYAKNLLHDLEDYIVNNFGFGDFVFRDPNTLQTIAVAKDLRSLQELMLTIPNECLKLHTMQDDFSKWLNARALFPIAQKFKPAKYEDFENIEAIRKYIYDAIASFRVSKARGIIAEFDKGRFDEYLFFSRIGEGSLGGKARGLAFINSIIKKEKLFDKFPGVQISVPATVVLTTEVFEEFMERNNLYQVAMSNMDDEKILEHFQKAAFPDSVKEDLFAVASLANTPIAVRSSSKLEDSYYQPFAGIYNTYMVPVIGNRHVTVQMLIQAIKGVYASVYFKTSKAYMAATANVIDEEKMGIILQSVCGNYYGNLFHPTFAGVARSINYYPIEPEKPEDGVVNIGYGLGKLIVDGGNNIRFSPKYPKKIIQLANPELAMRDTQKHFYTLDLNPDAFEATVDDKSNLKKLRMKQAEVDPAFWHVASSYDLDNHIIRDGYDSPGKKIVTFSNILNHNSFPLADIISNLLSISQQALNNPVEIEFAANLDMPEGAPKQFNYLQVRPIVHDEQKLTSKIEGFDPENTILYSEKALGHGSVSDLCDFIYVKPEEFDPRYTQEIATELETLNQKYIEENRYYILVGPGRWGSSDSWLGIPVKWTQISQARLIVESGLEDFRVDPSQGTHFFHNLTSFGVGYFTINPSIDDGFYNIDYLNGKNALLETKFLRAIRFKKCIPIKIDGRHQKGVILKSRD